MTIRPETFHDTLVELHRLVGVAHQQLVYLVQTGHGVSFARSTGIPRSTSIAPMTPALDKGSS